MDSSEQQEQSERPESPQDALALLRELAADQEQVTLKARRLDVSYVLSRGTPEDGNPLWVWRRGDLLPSVPSRKWPYASIKKYYPYWIRLR